MSTIPIHHVHHTNPPCPRVAGYGNIAPITKAGRVATMLYAVIGVPLALIVLADLGHRLAQALKFLWGFVRRYYYTGYCRKPSAAASKRSYDMNESQAGLGVGVGGGAGGGVGVDGVFRSGSKQWEGSGTVYRQESEGRQRQRTSVTPVRGDREGTPLAQQAALGRGEAGENPCCLRLPTPSLCMIVRAKGFPCTPLLFI